MGVPSEQTGNFHAAQMLRLRGKQDKGPPQLPLRRNKKGLQRKPPKLGRSSLDPGICSHRPHPVHPVHSVSGTLVSPPVQPPALLQDTAEAHLPSPHDSFARHPPILEDALSLQLSCDSGLQSLPGLTLERLLAWLSGEHRFGSFDPISAARQVCLLGQVPLPPWNFLPLSVKWANWIRWFWVSPSSGMSRATWAIGSTTGRDSVIRSSLALKTLVRKRGRVGRSLLQKY